MWFRVPVVLYNVLWVLGRVVRLTSRWIRLRLLPLKTRVKLHLAIIDERRNDAIGFLTRGMTAEIRVCGR